MESQSGNDRKVPPVENGGILPKVGQLPVVEPAVHFGRRHPHLVAGAFFFSGFVWDAITLQRIDSWFDNLLLALYLSCLTVLIVAQARAEFGERGRFLDRVRPHLRDAVQFCMGALFSAVVIFYWQSASLTRTSTYLLILVALLLANEFVHRRGFNLVLLVSLYYLAAASFLIFFIPVVAGSMGFVTFILSCVLSAGLAIGLVFYLSARGIVSKARPLWKSVGSVVVLFALLNAFYLTNLIPPVPLAMKFGGVFHEVVKSGDTYFLTFEKPRWYRFWTRSNDPFRLRPGDQVYCFAAVFAPTDFRETVYHAWQYLDDETGRWMQSDRIGYAVTGGRGGGYRGFTVKRNIEPGTWRVLVQDGRGFVLGRISFDVVRVNGEIGTLVTKSYH